eukprot:scaffold4991_cov156-Ochromonas_danica.AAC.5
MNPRERKESSKKKLTETLQLSIQEIAKAKRKLKKIQKLCRKVDEALEIQETSLLLQEEDHVEVRPLLDSLENTLKSSHRSSQINQARHEKTCTALDDLVSKIRGQEGEVSEQIEKMKAKAYEWQASNIILQQGCRQAALQAHDFEEMHYNRMTEIPVSQLPSLKQLQEQRQGRSEAFDQLHWRLLKQLRLMAKQCDYLQLEIESREHIRARLKALTMELHSALEEDCQDALAQALAETDRSLDQVLKAVTALPSLERQEFISNGLGTSATICPNSLERNNLNPSEPITSNIAVELNGRQEASIMSSLSDEEDEEDAAVSTSISYVGTKYLSPKHLEIFRPQSAQEEICQDQITKLLNRPSAPVRTKKTLKIQTRDFPRNVDRIHIRLKSFHDSVKKVNIDDVPFEGDLKDGTNDGFGMKSRPNDGKDPLSELLACKKALRRMQSCSARAACSAINTTNRRLILADTRGSADQTGRLQNEDEHLRGPLAATYSSSRQELEHWMEQSLLDKYKLAMNLLNTELAKHDWPAHFIPTFHMDGIHKHTSKAHHTDGGDRQGENQKQKGGTEGSREERRHDEIMRQRDRPFNLQLMSPVEEQDMILSDLPTTPLAMSEQLVRENNEEILLRINKMMSEDEYVSNALKKQLMLNRQAVEKEISPEDQLEDEVVLSEKLTIEVIMDGDNFYVTFDVKPSQREVSLNARKYLQRNIYKECTMQIPFALFCDVTGSHEDVIQQQLLNDRYKFFQQVKGSFHVERLPPQFYDMMEQKVLENEKPETLFTIAEIESMLSTAIDPNAGGKNFPHPHVLKVFTLRSKSGGI